MSPIKGNFAVCNQRTSAFKEHYYELVTFDIPLEFLEDALIRNMKLIGKPMFKVPAEHTKINKDLIFIFDVDEEFNVYYYKHTVSEKKIIREYKQDVLYNEFMA